MPSKRFQATAVSPRASGQWLGIALIVGLAYVLLQPLLNSQFGWQLPALENSARQRQTPPTPQASTDKPAQPQGHPQLASPTTADGRSAAGQAADSAEQASERLRYGVLRQTGPEEFLSPAGLRYSRGSAEGHRLKHLQRHLQDDPSRPGRHGVFDGDMAQALRWIDQAYTQAQRGAPASSQQQDHDRTVYEARFGHPIGYVGGRDGRSDNHPAAYRLRLVLEGDEFITAFPF